MRKNAFWLPLTRDRHLVAIGLEDIGNLSPTGTISEGAMHQNYIFNLLTHDYSPLR
jgi:hypothetical protein